jgi:DNA-directed RNA polymerase
MRDTDLSIHDLLKDEERFEVGAVREATEKYYAKLAEAKQGKGDLLLFTPEMKLLIEKVPPLASAISAEINKVGGRSTKLFRDALGDINPDELAVMTIRHCFNHYMGDQTLQTICIKLADDVRVHKDDSRFQRDFKGYYKVVERSIASATPIHRHKVLTHARHRMGVDDTRWEKNEKLLIGKLLIDCFLYTGELFYVDEFVKPKKLYVKKLGRNVQLKGLTLKTTEWTEKWLEKNHKTCSILTPVLKPMVVPPRPWSDPWSGGYVSKKFAKGYRSCRLIRNVKAEWLRQNASRIAPEVYEGVNFIQSTPYRINRRVLEVVDDLKISGMAKLPDGTMPKLKLPPKPWKTDQEFAVLKENNPEKVKAWSQKAHKIYQDYWNEKSKRTSLNEKIRIAKMFKGYSAIYFPVNLDWRGRSFCMSTPVLTPQGDDAAKGILEYADGKEITAEGFIEFCIHGANVFGEDKLTEEKRCQWVDEHHEDILLVDKEPYGEAQLEWWSNADKPFQFLAWCFEYAAYQRNRSFKSHLICHIDQTCSGLQHWSSVLHDAEGAASVGCIDKPEPDDIYQTVADKVEEMLLTDDDPWAKAWQGKVTRTITKRNVMTKLYGATMPGMRDQVLKELNDLDKKGTYLPGAPGDNFAAAQYIARMNNKAMAEVVAKATEGMDYVQAVAKTLAEAGKSVNWTSPMGLPIEQTYWQTKTKRIATYWLSVDISTDSSQRIRLNLSEDQPEKGVQVKKAEQSIAPNYIHSMDASHLMFIALAWKDREGAALTTVHDSFGCHASDLPALHKVVREQFVAMYEESDHLYDFQRDASAKLGDVADIARPSLGTQDVSQVLTATYFCR